MLKRVLKQFNGEITWNHAYLSKHQDAQKMIPIPDFFVRLSAKLPSLHCVAFSFARRRQRRYNYLLLHSSMRL